MEHQFKKKTFYLPQWEVEYLFIGTFNPSVTLLHCHAFREVSRLIHVASAHDGDVVA